MTLFIATFNQDFDLSRSSATEEDREDIRLCTHGDEEAYARLVKRYEILIARQMWRFTRSPQTLEELVQEVFVEAYTSLHSYKGTSPFEHWLRKIATRVGYKFWKHKSRDNERRTTLEQNKLDIMPIATNAIPSEAAEYLFTLLETLPVQERMVLSLLYFEGWDTQEIADHMGWSRSLVKVRAFRARKKLKTKLELAGYAST
ncbi:MAG TPA: sigma-70 family RNA polymerase sigma factor [Candidatus Hydrogenedentes bacterium]|nr:sigma-70 family RNA polymerase sigma factor [Candidatus Hydrogenedentota bacterium]